MKKTQPLEAAEVENDAVDSETNAVQTPSVEASKAAKPEEPTFTIEQLRPDARVLFGVSQSTYDGATASIDREQTFTVDGMRQHIERWLKEEY